jgi:hypothetical protein
MRVVFGLLLLLSIAFGFGQATSISNANQPGSAPATESAMTLLKPARGSIFQTVAAVDANQPVVQAAPDAPKATPIDPIVAPIIKAVPSTPVPAKGKAAAPSKAKRDKAKADSVPVRPGFKLTCTSSQKLDAAKKRCVALRSAAVAGGPRA